MDGGQVSGRGLLAAAAAAAAASATRSNAKDIAGLKTVALRKAAQRSSGRGARRDANSGCDDRRQRMFELQPLQVIQRDRNNL